MSGIKDLIAASHTKKPVSAGRKEKIVARVKSQMPKDKHPAVQKMAEQVLSKKDSTDKDDKALVAEIKAALQGNFTVTSAAARLIEAAGTATQVYTLGVNDGDGALWRLLEFLKDCGYDGHSVSFKIDDQSFGFDGDGADKIVTMDRDEAP